MQWGASTTQSDASRSSTGLDWYPQQSKRSFAKGMCGVGVRVQGTDTDPFSAADSRSASSASAWVRSSSFVARASAHSSDRREAARRASVLAWRARPRASESPLQDRPRPSRRRARSCTRRANRLESIQSIQSRGRGPGPWRMREVNARTVESVKATLALSS